MPILQIIIQFITRPAAIPIPTSDWLKVLNYKPQADGLGYQKGSSKTGRQTLILYYSKINPCLINDANR